MSEVNDAIKNAIDGVDESDPKLDELSLDELKALANGENAKPAAKPAKPAATPEDDETDEPEEFEYRIDLEDGSGVQVFKGASVEEVMQKLGDAQKHATRKIREQAEQLKKYSAQAEKDAADNEYVIGQELISKPTAAFKKMFKETTGVDIEQFKNKWERVEALDRAQQIQAIENKKNAAATEFLAAHPEFVANKSNGARLEKAVNILVAEANSKNIEPDFSAFLETAYTDLSESGLLELKDGNDDSVSSAAPKEPKPPVVQVSAHTRRSSGLSSRARTVTTPKNTEPTEDELMSMPLDKLRDLANKRS